MAREPIKIDRKESKTNYVGKPAVGRNSDWDVRRERKGGNLWLEVAREPHIMPWQCSARGDNKWMERYKRKKRKK
jgi:hypothetical protein